MVLDKFMNANQILAIYLILFFIRYFWESFLEMLNREFVKKNSRQPPAFISAVMDSETFNKSAVYTLAKSNFQVISSSFSSLFTLILILSGFLGWLDQALAGWQLGLYAQGILYIFSLALIYNLFSLPFSLYAQFSLEQKFGFNKMTLPLFFIDLLKSAIVSALLATPLLLLLFLFMDTAGPFWWLFAFAGITCFQFILVFLYPTFIAPLFNKFTPLADGLLKEKIERLAQDLHFKTSGIFVMDGSKRSTHGNAYFTGLGSTKRIVFFDTLFKDLNDEQIVAVLAHEIGHEKESHIKKSLAVSLITMLLGLWILSLLLPYEPFFIAFGFTHASNYAALIIFTFLAGPFTFFIDPLFAIWSRKHEYEADRFAAQALGSGRDLKEALLKISQKNLSNPLPHPWYSFYHYSHPTLLERIKALDKLS